MRITEIIKPPTPDQARIKALSANKKRASDALKAEFVMTIRSGMVKLIRNIVDGRERIVRVLRQGDVVGLEAIATGQYGHEAVALTELSVCRIPIQLIQQLSTTSPRLHNRLTTQ